MNKFEKLIEYIINDEDQKARELFHDIVVEKSRDIYESIMDEESMEETVHGQDNVESMVDEITHEEAVGEEDEEGSEMELDHDADSEVGDELAMHGDDAEEAEHEEIEDKVMDIDAKLDELLAKFDEIMGHEGGEEMPAMHDEEPAMDEMGMMESKDEEDEEDEEDDEEEEEEEEESKDDKKTESRSNKSTSELMREYVDRIGDIYGGAGDAAEGDAVGSSGKKTSVNTKSEVGPGADFGGKAVTSKGGNQDQDGTTPTKASNEYTKGEGKLIGKVGNTPGGNKKLSATGDKYETAKDAEGKLAGNDGSAPINKKSEIGGKVR
jgi:hypothetical protein